MGIRITAFALDCVGFSAWLERPVANVLFYVARHAEGEPLFFHVFEPESRQRYLISTKREVLRVGIGAVGAAVPLTPESAAGIPILRRPLADYIREEDGLPFKFLLSSPAACPQEKWLRVLAEGHRPWWLFSVLRAAKETFLVPPDLRDLEELCARILRGYHFREPVYLLKSHTLLPSPASLPVLPRDDADSRMAVFLPTDCVRWLELIDTLLERVTLFKSPASWFRQTDAEADKHVRQMLASFDVLRRLPLPDPRLVTFID